MKKLPVCYCSVDGSVFVLVLVAVVFWNAKGICLKFVTIMEKHIVCNYQQSAFNFKNNYIQ